jgi:CO/xanthine dehydrogenase Mo-binding subunit/CO/xanthine dehydrogenase FAD-binding subunit
MKTTKVVGRRSRPSDWEERTTGRTVFASDVSLPGMLHAAVVRSPHPHAAVESIDASVALSLPGVHAVVTAADLPAGTRYVHGGGAQSDRPPLADGVVRYIGQEVAAVAADTEALARAGAAAVRVRYRRLPAPIRVEDSAAIGAPVLHERADGPNLAAAFTGSWGTPSEGWRASDVVVRGTFSWPRQSQLPMEPQAVVARWDDRLERLDLWPSTQAPFFVALEVATALGIGRDAVRCHEVAVGGGFGAKSKVGEHEVLAALLARAARRPVRLVLTRHEEFSVTKTRHPVRIELQTGAAADGRIAALRASIRMENGAYNHYGPAVLRVAIKTLGSIYGPDAVEWDAQLVDTATQPGGPFRGYGAPQVAWATEQQVDELAAQLGIDPLELRRRNANRPGTTMRNGSRLGTARLAECLDAVEEAIGWRAARATRTPSVGVGVAAGSHGSGSYAFVDANRSDAVVEIDLDGRVTVRHGGADAGTGQRTILRDIAAEVLGCAPAAVTVEMMAPDVFDQGAWSSRGTHMSGHAVRHVAELAADGLRDLAAKKLGTSDVALADGRAVGGGDDVGFGDLVALADDAVDGVWRVRGSYVDPRMELYDPANPTPNVAATYTFAAHAAKVHVDVDTGRITVLDYVAAHDLGRALNPAQAESQIIGGVATGIGAALGEELRHDEGRLANGGFVSYAMPRAADLPTVRPIVVEGADPDAPFDAKSVGEMAVIPVAAAIANAVHDATGVRLRDLPMTPDRVLVALRAAGVGTAPPAPVRWRRSPRRWWVEAMRRAYPLGLHRVLHTYGTRLARRRPAVEPADLALVAPPTTEAVLDAAAVAGSLVIGAGTDAVVQARHGLVQPVRLVSTRGARAMRRIERTGDVLHIGGAATLQAARDACDGLLPVVQEAVDAIASLPLRGTATVAGNLLQGNRCWYLRGGFDCYKAGGSTCPCYAVGGEHRFHHAVIDAHRCQSVTPSDLATALVVLDATVEVAHRSGRVRTLHAHELHRGPGEHVLDDGEVLVSLAIPLPPSGTRSTYEKLSLYTGGFAVASVALSVRLDDGIWRDVRLALGAMAPVPWRAREAERLLEGTPATPATVRRALLSDLAHHAHPLPGNGWKIDLAAGLAARAAARVHHG